MHAAHKAAAPTGDWLSTVYFQDSTHPSRFGQKLVAGVMAHRLTRQLVHRQPDPHASDQTAAADDGGDRAPPPAQRGDSHRGKRKFLTQQASDFFSVGSSHSLLDFTDPLLAGRAPRGFVAHKAGFARLEVTLTLEP